MYCNWPKLVTQAEHKVKSCKTCLKFKKTGERKYGKLSAKLSEVELWAHFAIDLIVPYSVATNRLNVKSLPIELTLTAMTFIDFSTGWF